MVSSSKLINRYIALIVVGGALAFTGIASAAGQLSVSPNTNLKDGQIITVTGSGFAKNSTGAILECNGDAAQPTITVAGGQVPVSCTNPLNAIVTTDAKGSFGAQKLTVHTGTIGPPTAGTDSKGNSAGADAALYPCPPTAAQIAAGDTCVVTFGDATNESASAILSFYSASQGSSTSSKTTTGGNTTQSDNSAPTQLVNTGPGNVAFVAVILAVVSGSAFYLVNSIKKARI